MNTHCNIHEIEPGDYVRTSEGFEEIASIWGLENGRLAKPSEGGFGVVTKTGKRVTMWDALSYHKKEKKKEADTASAELTALVAEQAKSYAAESFVKPTIQEQLIIENAMMKGIFIYLDWLKTKDLK